MQSIKKEVLKGDKRNVSKALSFVENREKGFLDLLDELYIKGKPAKILGVTGAPGVGKSSLIDLYVEELLKRGKKVAVIAVDPTSPFTGGALLGDRIRMKASGDSVFIRSVATRGAFGGVSDAVFNMMVVFRAAGFDYIIIETVGVGQNEIGISKLADLVLLVMNPGSGDDIQMMKAGIMETGDVFIINKSDLPGADELEAYIKSVNPGFYKKILKTCVHKNKGISELADAVEELYSTDAEDIKNRSKKIIKEGLKLLLMQEFSCKVESLLDSAEIKLDGIVNASTSPYKELQRILDGGFKKW